MNPSATKCRLFYVVGQLRMGGLERQLYLLLQALNRERYGPEVFVWNYQEEGPYISPIRALRVPIHAPKPGSSALGKLTHFRRLVGRIEPQVVHSYTFYTNFAAWFAALGTRSLAVGSLRTDFKRAKRNTGALLGRLSARWPRIQIFNSRAAARTAQQSRSCFSPEKVLVVRNGLNTKDYPLVPLPENGIPLMLGIGTLSQVKRWDRFLAALSSLQKGGLRLRGCIVGDGPLRESLIALSRELGLESTVEFPGRRENVQEYLARSIFLVHTSDTEGCPNVVIEAMASGRAVVATDSGDIADLVENQKTGYVVRPGDDSALVDRVAQLLSDRKRCRQMGEAGRAKAKREFGIDRLVLETLAAYRSAGWKED